MRISRLVRHVFGFGAYSRTPSPDILSIAQCLRLWGVYTNLRQSEPVVWRLLYCCMNRCTNSKPRIRMEWAMLAAVFCCSPLFYLLVFSPLSEQFYFSLLLQGTSPAPELSQLLLNNNIRRSFPPPLLPFTKLLPQYPQLCIISDLMSTSLTNPTIYLPMGHHFTTLQLPNSFFAHWATSLFESGSDIPMWAPDSIPPSQGPIHLYVTFNSGYSCITLIRQCILSLPAHTYFYTSLPPGKPHTPQPSTFVLPTVPHHPNTSWQLYVRISSSLTLIVTPTWNTMGLSWIAPPPSTRNWTPPPSRPSP